MLSFLTFVGYTKPPFLMRSWFYGLRHLEAIGAPHVFLKIYKVQPDTKGVDVIFFLELHGGGEVPM